MPGRQLPDAEGTQHDRDSARDWVPPGAISVELRATDSSTAPHSAGTEIPVGRPSDFRTTTLTLAHVPLNGHSRTPLRLYGIGNGTAVVRAIGLKTGAKLLETTVTLASGDTTTYEAFPNQRVTIPSPPSYATLALPATDGADNAMRIEVVPADGVAVWGFASVTDNASEQFTIVSPETLDAVETSAL